METVMKTEGAWNQLPPASFQIVKYVQQFCFFSDPSHPHLWCFNGNLCKQFRDIIVIPFLATSLNCKTMDRQ